VSLHFFSVQLIPRFLKKRLRFLNHLAACINVTAQVMVRPLGVHKPCFPVVIHLRDPLAAKRKPKVLCCPSIIGSTQIAGA
jgi:hypothetical protein